VAEGREIVYCHRCLNEWYQDEHPDSLACPSCHCDFTEIVRASRRTVSELCANTQQVSAENDPREAHGALPTLSQRRFPYDRRGSDSDPDEDDINEHIFHGPGGFFGQRNLYRSPEMSTFGQRTRIRPGNSDDIIRRFTEMIQDMSGPGLVGRSGPETLYDEEEEGGPRIVFRSLRGPGFAGGVSSFTITTGSSPARYRDRSSPGLGPGAAPRPAGEDFQRYI
jgi:E3 ubiquitin-protein ligase RNF115/126